MQMLRLFTVLLFLLHYVVIKSQLAAEDSIYYIFHSFDGASFALRTRIQLMTKPDGLSHFVFLDKNGIDQNSIENFKKILSMNDFYQIKIQSGSEGGTTVLASIPAVLSTFSRFCCFNQALNLSAFVALC